MAADGRASVAPRRGRNCHADLELRAGGDRRHLPPRAPARRHHDRVAPARAGPLTTVPLPGDASSLVWVEEPADAARLAALDDAAFLAELAARLQGLLGALGDVGPRARVSALAASRAERMGQNRVALVGRGGARHPADRRPRPQSRPARRVQPLPTASATARARGRGYRRPAVLEAYHAARAADVMARTVSVDLLNRSLLRIFCPCRRCAASGCMSSPTSGRCAASSCGGAWTRPGACRA